jgi:hypothetical protein
MTHARIPDFSRPAPVRAAQAAPAVRRRLPVDGRFLNLPNEPVPGGIEPWEAVAPVRPDTAHNWSLRFLDATGELLAAVAIIGGGIVLTGFATLRDRATELRGSLSRRTVVADTVAAAVPLPVIAAPQQQERAEYRARLLAAYAEDRRARPVAAHLGGWTLEHEASKLVYVRCWNLAREIVALPPSTTIEGMGLTALAAAILIECDFTSNDPTITAAVGLTRAILATTGTALPPGFVGFGDEPDHGERDDALHAASDGKLPEWALARAQAKFDAEDEDDA